MCTRGVTTSRARICILARVVLVSFVSFETLLFTNFGHLVMSTLGILTVSGVARGGPSRARPDQLCSSNAYYLTVDCVSPSIL